MSLLNDIKYYVKTGTGDVDDLTQRAQNDVSLEEYSEIKKYLREKLVRGGPKLRKLIANPTGGLIEKHIESPKPETPSTPFFSGFFFGGSKSIDAPGKIIKEPTVNDAQKIQRALLLLARVVANEVIPEPPINNNSNNFPDNDEQEHAVLHRRRQ